MEVKFKVVSGNNRYHGTFDSYEDAEGQAHEMANYLQEDMFIEKITIELIKRVTPDDEN